MRIAFVVGSFPEISTTFILDQVTGLLDLGHDVEIFARVPARAPVHAAVERYRLIERTHYWESDPLRTAVATLARTTRLFARAPARALTMLRRSAEPIPRAPSSAYLRQLPHATSMMLAPRPYDVIVAHFGTNGVAAQRLRDLGVPEAPLVTVFHGYDVSRILRERGPAYYARLFERGELFLPVSEHFRTRLVEAGCPAARTQVHRMGVDTASFQFRARTRAAGEPTRFVTVCRMIEKKGLEYTLRAMAKLKARGIPFTWDVAGDGPLRERIEALRNELDVGAHVTLHGTLARAEVQALLERAHVFVQPSITAQDGDQEGIPVAIMEAMAVGLPVVSTRHSGIPELVEHGVSGYLVGERDSDELAARLFDIASEPERWPTMGERGQRKVADDFDEAKLNRQLAERLLEVSLQAKRRARS